jgi:lysozyme
MAIAAAAVLLLLIAVLLQSGRDTVSSIKPLIDVPLSEEQTGEVVYTQGVDVSNYQGEIDFDVLHEQGIQFVFIKATEGNSWVDQRFQENWKKASRCKGLRYGAYHFMSFRTPGSEQASSFINTVPKDKDALPPVVDIELYEEFINSPPSQEHFQETLNPILEAMEKQYGKTPILYTTSYVYNRYILGNYDNPIWIADHSLPAALPDGTPWLFCQYSYEGQLEGYDGEEPYIDLDVFNGSPEQLQEL